MKTVKVKIAVVVGPNGKWYSCGWSGEPDQELMELAEDAIRADGTLQYWLTATLATPEAMTVEANVDVVAEEALIAGTHIRVNAIKRFSAAGYSTADILKEYPSLTEKDVEAAIEALA